MSRLRFSSRFLSFATAVASCVVCVALMGASRGAITKLTLNPDAPVVDLFEGMEHDQFEVRLVAQNPHEGRIFITNKTDKPLTVAVPKGLVGVHVLPQFNLNGANNLLGNQQPGGLNNGQNGQAGQNGLAQSVGGNASPIGNNAFPGGGNGFPANNGLNNNFPNAVGFFSIPPEKTVQIALSSVCLNYGRREPNAALKYRLVKAETVTTDPVLLQLLEDYSPRTNREFQQAAAWHLANGLTWERISQLTDQKVPGIPTPLFSAGQIQGARELVDQVKKNAANRPKKADAAPSVVAK
jgi:hypothetical protein